MGFRQLVLVVVVCHLAFIAYVVFGGFLARTWPRTLVPYAMAVGWGLVGTVVPIACPLTAIENDLRQRAGEPTLRHGFIDQYLSGVVYPAGWGFEVRVLAMGVALVSGLAAYRRWRSSHAPARPR
jgi:Na+(H+)/acetate symporter ActP